MAMKARQEDQNGNGRPKIIPMDHGISHIDDRWTEFKIIGKNVQSRSHHISVQYKGTLYVHGGYDADKGILSDFYKMDLTGKQDGFRWLALPQKDPNYPGKLKSHSAVIYKNQLLIFGGQTVQLNNTNIVWKFNFDTQKWSKITPSINLPRLDSHKAIIDDKFMYVYGGFIDSQACYSSAIYRLNCDSNQWQIIFSQKQKDKSPCARGSSSLVLFQGQLWIFGGTNGKTTLNDMWKFNLAKRQWQKLQSNNCPEPRRSHTMVVSNGYFWMFGGIQDVTKQKNDIYLFDPRKLEWTKIMNASNMVYQCSPTMKLQKHSNRKRQSPKKQTKFSLGLQSSGTDNKDTKVDSMKRILQENKQKKFLQRKNQLLKQFVIKGNQKNQRTFSPTSESMLKTLEIIGDQQQSKKMLHNEIMYDPSLRFIIGKKPCARDAHTSLVFQGKMLIFGGDRHLMSFSDIFFFDLQKGMQSRELYKKHYASQETR